MTITKPKINRGSILIVAVLFTFLTFLAAFTLFKVLPMEFNAAKSSRLDTNAHYVLDAGTKDAIAWMESQPALLGITNADLSKYNSTFGPRREFSTGWEYKTEIEQIEAGHYGITTKAYHQGRKIRESKTQVMREGFERYAFFIDYWPHPDSPEDNPVYALGSEMLTGPFHTNDFFQLGHKSGSDFKAGSNQAPFVSTRYGRMTHSGLFDTHNSLDFTGDGNAYVALSKAVQGSSAFNSDKSVVPYNDEGPVEERYSRIIEGGRGMLSLVPYVYFPDAAFNAYGEPLREEARGEAEFMGKLKVGVYPAIDSSDEMVGGIYVIGDADIDLSIVNGNQLQRFSQAHEKDHFYEIQEREVEVPVYKNVSTSNPSRVPIYGNVTRCNNVVVGHTNVMVEADGLITSSKVPQYEKVCRDVWEQIGTEPYDPDKHGSGPWTVRQQVGTETRTVTELKQIPEDQYDHTNPNHTVQIKTVGKRDFDVLEVTENGGVDLAALNSSATFSKYNFSDYDVSGASTGLSIPRGHTVFIDHAEKNIVVSKGGTNGITFVDGNVTSLKGTNKGARSDQMTGGASVGRTIVAAPESKYSVTVTGDLYQYDPDNLPSQRLEPGTLPATGENALGIISHDVYLKPNFATSEDNPLNIYAVVLAGSGQYTSDGKPLMKDGRQVTSGGFSVDKSLLNQSRLGKFRLYGGVIQAHVGTWIKTGGMAGDLIFDPAAATGMQNFPSTDLVRVIRYSEYASFKD